jgi:hypothetical protein
MRVPRSIVWPGSPGAPWQGAKQAPPGASSRPWARTCTGGRGCNTAVAGWGCGPNTRLRVARGWRGGCAPGRIVSPSPCASPPGLCPTRRVPWEPSCGGCKHASVPQKPSRPPHTSWRGWSRACGNTGAPTSNRASTPPQRHPVHASSQRWPSKPRPGGIHWCPSQRRDKTASPGRSGRACPPRAPPMPRDATGRKGAGAGLRPVPSDSYLHPSTVALQRRPPLPKRSSPFPRRSLPSARKA